ncbi:nucleoside hydrolase [Halobacteriales archaeon QS_3_64_16]|nr:MAG: nucleoside hydrolase [Halobacteriales archaeon QS_3_64_16]
MTDRRVIIDSDTAGDDALAILLATLSDRLAVEGVSIVAGNAAFDHEVANAKYTLELAGAAEEVPVYEGARRPLLKDHETAEYVHGAGGLAGIYPDPDVDSADAGAVDFLLDTVRESPGEITLLCIGPLTNVALACSREPRLNDLLDEVWVMGGAFGAPGNITPAAEYNFWVDPDAAKIVLRDLDVSVVGWGVCTEGSVLGGPEIDRIASAREESTYADFFVRVTEPVREFTEGEQGIEGATQPDSLTVACCLDPEIVCEASTYHVDIDEREGLTRGYSVADVDGITDGDARTRVIEEVDEERFQQMFTGALVAGDPERSIR